MRATLRFDEESLKAILRKHCMTLSNVQQVKGVRFNIDQGDPGDPRDRGQTVTVEVELEMDLEKP